MQQHIRERLVEMNWHFGRGEVEQVCFETNTVTRRIPITQRTGTTDTRKFRVQGETLFFLGHQSKVTQPMRI